MVTCKVKLDKSKLVSGSRVSLDMTTLTIMRLLPREAAPTAISGQLLSGELPESGSVGLREVLRVSPKAGVTNGVASNTAQA